MEPWQEPVRGEPLPAGAFALEGIERLRGWGRLLPPTPMFHLLGIRITQLVSGSVVASQPVSPWLQHPDGVLEIGFLGDVVCGMAGDTVLKPGVMLVPLEGSYRPLRRLQAECRTLIGRANVVRTTRDWVYVRGVVEDDEGRTVADFSMQAAQRPVGFPVPEVPPDFEPIVMPSYGTPDPHMRPLPPDKHAVIDHFRRDGCIPTFQAIAAGQLSMPPLYSLFGVHPLHAERGSVTTELATSRWLRSVHPTDVGPPYLRTQAVSTGVAALWTVLPEDAWPAIVGFHTTFVDAAPSDGRRIVARATAERLGVDMVRAEVETVDGDRPLAVSVVSAHVRPKRSTAPRGSRSLATVLFTDLVDSTNRASELGDHAWNVLLERHQRLVRRRLQDHHGREIKSTGDGFLVTFETPTAAVECACDIREAVRGLDLEIRAGLHAGEIEFTGGDVAGIAVHVAARVQSAATPGEVWVSETVKGLLTGSGIDLEDRGVHDLKGVDDNMHLWSATPTHVGAR